MPVLWWNCAATYNSGRWIRHWRYSGSGNLPILSQDYRSDQTLEYLSFAEEIRKQARPLEPRETAPDLIRGRFMFGLQD